MPKEKALKNTQREIPPNIKQSDPPQFWEMDEYVFQDMCCALLNEELPVSVCHVYGKRGQGQQGIDLLAYRSGSNETEVGQCKCYEDFPPRKILEASDEFFKHLAYWKSKNVRRFVLFVACDLSLTQRQKEILKQRERFSDEGIEYEAWGGRTLATKLGKHRHIVSQFLITEYWINHLCGPQLLQYEKQAVGVDGRSNAGKAFLEAQLGELAERLDKQIAGEIETLLQETREGRSDRVMLRLVELRNDGTTWSSITPENQAKILRLTGSLALNRNDDISLAKSLANDAGKIFEPDGPSALRAQIIWREEGAEEAVEFLKDGKTIDALHIRAGALIQLSRPEEALKDLKTAEELSQDNPKGETYRLSALAHLLNGDMAEADKAIERALHLDPRGRLAQLVAPVISFNKCLASSAPSRGAPLYPNPVDWTWVKRDNQSITDLRNAQQNLRSLIASEHFEDDDIDHAKLWLLACLSIDPEGREEAEEICKEILNKQRTNFGAIAWAVSRNYNINFKRSQKAFETLIAEKKADIPHCLALTSCYLQLNNRKKALKLLDEVQNQFETEGQIELWWLWKIQIDVITGKKPVSLPDIQNLDANSHEIRTAMAMALASQSRKDKNADALKELARSTLGDAGDLGAFFTSCEFLAQLGEWSFLYEHKEALLNQIGTEDSVRMAVFAAFNIREPEQALEILEAHQSIFPNASLPYDLRNLSIDAKRQLGHLNEAIFEAEDLARKNPEASNLLGLANLRLARGDIHGFMRDAHQAVEKGGLPPEQTLRIAQIVRIEDPVVARKIAETVTTSEIPERLAAQTYDVLVKLGMEEAAIPAFEIMIAGANTDGSPARSASLEEILENQRNWQKWVQNAYEHYRNGIVPTHSFANAVNAALAEIMREVIPYGKEKKRENFENRPKVFIRHGGRPIPTNFPNKPSDWNLHIDISALILAEAIGLLGIVEKTFKPLRISPQSLLALIDMREKILPHQPARIEIIDQVCERIKKGKISVCINAPEREKDDAVILEWTSKISEQTRGCFINGPAVLEALRHHSPLSKAIYDAAKRSQEAEIQLEPSNLCPVAGVNLLCSPGTTEMLERLGLLSSACNTFKISIYEDEQKLLEQESHNAQSQNALADWLGTLTKRLDYAIEEGTYQVLPEIPLDNLFDGKDGQAEFEQSTDHTELALFHFLKLQASEGAIVWIDDRFLTAHSDANGIPIAGVTDILMALLHYEAITEEKYFEFVRRLREGNQRFIPLEKAEILFHLNAAPVSNGEISETNELKTLRAYFASCWDQGDDLQKPPVPKTIPNQNGEIGFIVSHNRAVMDALVAVWQESNGSLDETCARADWIWENLAVLRYPGVPQGAETNEQKEALAIVQLSSLVISAINLDATKGPSGQSIRQNYFDWLDSRTLKNIFGANPHFIDKVSDVLAGHFLEFEKLGQDSDEELKAEAAYKALMNRLLNDMPKVLRSRLWDNNEVVEKLEIRIGKALTIGEWSFPADEFWASVESACAGETITIKGANEGKTFKVFQDGTENGIPVITVEAEEDLQPKRYRVVDALNGVFYPSPNERIKALSQTVTWHDVPSEKISKIIERIANLDNVVERIERTEEIKKDSAPAFYGGLLEHLREETKFSFNDLAPPSPGSLIRFHRLSEETKSEPFAKLLNNAAQHLIAEFGVETAIYRLAGIPVRFPSAIIDALKVMSNKSRRSLLASWKDAPHSPISRAHWIYASLSVNPSAKGQKNDIRAMALGLLGNEDENVECKSFLAILSWVSQFFGRTEELSSLPTVERLALEWSHTHQIFITFLKAGAPLPWLGDVFRSHQYRLTPEVFDVDPVRSCDVMEFTNVPQKILSLHSAAYSLSPGDDAVITEKIKTAFRNTALYEVEGQTGLIIALMRDTRTAPNALGSYLGDIRSEAFSLFLDTETLSPLTGEKIDETINNALKDIEQSEISGDPETAWLYLDATIWDQQPVGSVLERLKDLVGKLMFREMGEQNLDFAMHALRFLASQAFRFDDPEIYKHLEKQFRIIAGLCRVADSDQERVSGEQKEDEEDGTNQNDNHREKHLLHIANLLSVRPNDPLKTAEQFATILKMGCIEWPRLIPLVRQIVQRICDELRFDWTENLWALNHWLRARAD